MANVKVKPNEFAKAIAKSLEKQTEASLNRGIKQMQKRGIPLLKKEIRASIEDGKSPVLGEKFQKYSESYKDAIKRGRYPGKTVVPVNLKLTGRMLKTLAGRKTKTGFTLFYTDRKAKWHDEGTDKMPARRMLPKQGEKFNRTITVKFNELLRKIFK